MALDPSYFFYSDGTITLTNGSDIATGDMVVWDPAVLPFDFVFPNDGTGGMSVIKEVLAVNQIRLAKPWTGPTLTSVPYFMVRWANHIDPRFYAIRVSEYLTRVRPMPETGPNGWAPVLAQVVDGERRVLQIVDWTGGFGTKPPTGGYLGPAGTVIDIAQATDVRGPEGPASIVPGPQGDKGWSPVFAMVSDGARRVLQVDDWVGGAGTKPETGSYVGATGLVSDIAQAVDIRGPAGPAVGTNSVDNTLLADMPANTLKGRRTSAGDPEDLTFTEVHDLVVLNGSVIGSAYAEYTANASLSATIPIDDTVPQSTEGVQILSITYTPKSITSKIRVRFRGEVVTGSAPVGAQAALFNGGTDAVRSTFVSLGANNQALPLGFDYEHTPGSTSAQTYTVRVGPSTGSIRLNGTSTGRLLGGTMAATLVVEEIKA